MATEEQGKKYNMWTAASFSHKNERGEPFWFYFCECGTRKAVNCRNVRNGLSTNCGCVRKKKVGDRSRTHGLCKTPVYQSWFAMKQRCDNPNNQDFEHYGGRGIRYCNAWATFDGFAADMLKTWQKGLSIDRIDADGDYEPGNCRWATKHQQANNRRTSAYVMCPDGETRTISEAARLFGLPYHTLYHRVVVYGWPESEWFDAVQPRAKKAKLSS